MFRTGIQIVLIAAMVLVLAGSTVHAADEANTTESPTVVEDRGSKTIAYSIFFVLAGIAVFIIFRGTRRW